MVKHHAIDYMLNMDNNVTCFFVYMCYVCDFVFIKIILMTAKKALESTPVLSSFVNLFCDDLKIHHSVGKTRDEKVRTVSRLFQLPTLTQQT